MTLDTFKSLWKKAHVSILADEKRFSELDAASGGDGDHGTAIVAAMNAMVTAQGDDFKTLLKAMSDKVMTEASGSTSTLFGSWIAGMGDAAPESAEIDAAALAKIFAGGLEEIQFTTKARVGDKTVMDTLIPATEALVAAEPNGIQAMLKAAAEAGKKGSEATAAMRARFGRARNLGDRSIGPVDAGSASMAVIFAAFVE